MTAPATRSPAASNPGEEPARRFAAELARLWPEGGRLGLAVSGGPDSLAMLMLAHAAIPDRFEAASVDHALRPASAAECARVAAICAERAIPCEILRVAVAPGNVQASARAARYAALGEWAVRRGLAAIATAHHADDQAETLLMRLNRRSGVAGLAGVRGRGMVPGRELALVRPLLGWRRAELETVVREAGLEPVRDPSNADERFERVRMRQALARQPLLDPLAIAGSAAHLADAEDAIGWAAAREWDERVRHEPGEIRYRPRAPRAIALRVIERAVALLGGSPRGGDVARLFAQLEAGAGGNIAGVLARAVRGEWRFTAEPPRRRAPRAERA